MLRVSIPHSCPLRAAKILWDQRPERQLGPSEIRVGRWHLSASCQSTYISALLRPSLSACVSTFHSEAKLEYDMHHDAAAARCRMKVEIVPSETDRCLSVGLLGRLYKAPTPAE